MSEHQCQTSRTCHCYLLAMEPNEDCPVHGVPENRCELCGRFMPRIDAALEETMKEYMNYGVDE